MKKVKKLPLPGMRNIKTAVSVLLCLVVYLLFPLLAEITNEFDGRFFELLTFIVNRQDPMFACIAAVVVMQSTVADSVSSGKSRIYGTAIGAAAGLLFLLINLSVPVRWLNILLIAIGVVFLIYVCNLLKLQNAVSISVITFLVILISIGQKSPFTYAVNRLLDTGIGIVISIFVNRYLNFPIKKKKSAKENLTVQSTAESSDGQKYENEN